MTVATAPGKLVVFGDYAVLEGAPAVAVSVDVRARAQVDVTGGRDSVFIDVAGGKAFDFVAEPGAPLVWTRESPGERGTLVAAVIDTCHELMHSRGPLPALRISLKTDAFFTSRGGSTAKLGLGSSAAALVALSGALLRALGIQLERDSLLHVCHTAHRRFQGGQGSGIDVAVALLGGVVGIRLDPRERYPAVDGVDWPDGLYMMPVWSGESASTPRLIERFFSYREADAEAFARHLRNLTTFAEQADAAWRAGAVPEILSALVGYDNALRSLDYDAHIGINSEAHERMRGLAEHHGAVYKTSGAGGGDFGIVLSDSRDAIKAAGAALGRKQFVVMSTALNVDGLAVAPGP